MSKIKCVYCSTEIEIDILGKASCPKCGSLIQSSVTFSLPDSRSTVPVPNKPMEYIQNERKRD